MYVIYRLVEIVTDKITTVYIFLQHISVLKTFNVLLRTDFVENCVTKAQESEHLRPVQLWRVVLEKQLNILQDVVNSAKQKHICVQINVQL